MLQLISNRFIGRLMRTLLPLVENVGPIWMLQFLRFSFLLVRIVGEALHSFHAHFLLERYDEHLKEFLGCLNNIQPEIVEYETIG